MTEAHRKSREGGLYPEPRFLLEVALLFIAVATFVAWGRLQAQTLSNSIPDITGNYDFLKPYNTLAILQEDQMLKGYINVLQGQSASDAVFSYPITSGERKGDHVEFETRKIHEKFYRFSGTVERGKGKKKGDPDYLELIGVLQIIRKNPVNNGTNIIRRQVILKSKGRTEREP